jgi:uncharacterized delta-60 repeat protein
MKKIILLLSVLLNLLSIGLSAQNGMLDNTFGSSGKVTTSVGTGNGEGWGMVIQDDWTIVVGGFEYNGVDSNFALTKYTRDGVLDNTFGMNGKVTTAMGAGNSIIHSLALQPDGKILAAGWAWNGTGNDFATARYNPNGTLDSSFGNNGKVTTSIAASNDMGTSVAMMSDWTIVVGGSSFNGQNYDFALVRYLADGSLDNSFGINGKVITPMGNDNDEINAITIQPDSSIVVAGTVSSGSNNSFGVARYNANGMLDNSFGMNGKVITPGGVSDDEAYSIVLQPDGKIVIGGYSSNGVNDDFGLVRYLSNGNQDSTFGINGRVITAIGDSDEDVYSVLVQPDGKLVAAGSYLNNGIRNYAMVRYNADGNLDNNFGANGKVTTMISASNNEAYAVAMQPDGKIIAAGYANDGTKENFSVARYISGLSLGVVDLSGSKNEILVFPNPLAQTNTLEYTLTQNETVSIRLVDMKGRTIENFITEQNQEWGEHQQRISIPDVLASGPYLIVISSLSGYMSVQVIK